MERSVGVVRSKSHSLLQQSDTCGSNDFVAVKPCPLLRANFEILEYWITNRLGVLNIHISTSMLCARKPRIRWMDTLVLVSPTGERMVRLAGRVRTSNCHDGPLNVFFHRP